MRRIAFLLALAWLCPQTAAAAETAACGLKLVNTVPITLDAHGDRVFVPVTINGTPKTFLLDTGGALTQISASAAHDLHLGIGESSITMLDMYGRAAVGAAHLDSFGIGRLQDSKATLSVMTSSFEGQPYVGILAADYMGSYDIELDFSAGKMNYFSKDHCEGKVVYWLATAIAAVPMLFRDFHLTLPVMLDGKPIKAMIDTGATDTVLFSSAAKQAFDITADSPGAMPLAENAQKDAFRYVFKNLSLEGITINNPHIVVLPDRTGSKDPNNDYVTGSRVQHVDDRDVSDPVMLIGMNILSKLHLYIAFGEQKIYITPASPPPHPQ